MLTTFVSWRYGAIIVLIQLLVKKKKTSMRTLCFSFILCLRDKSVSENTVQKARDDGGSYGDGKSRWGIKC